MSNRDTAVKQHRALHRIETEGLGIEIIVILRPIRALGQVMKSTYPPSSFLRVTLLF